MPIHQYKQGDVPPAPPGDLQSFTGPSLRVRFGFKAVEDEGKWFWEPATENDFRKSEAERLNIREEDVHVEDSCHSTGPQSCSGFCGMSGGICSLVYNPSGHYYYCACT